MQLVQQTNVYNCVLHSVYPSIRLSVGAAWIDVWCCFGCQ